MQTNIKILDGKIIFTTEKFRVPLMFGSGHIESITKATCSIKVVNKKGNTAYGYGQILLSDLWAFPSNITSHENKDKIMREIAEKYLGFLTSEINDYLHPVDLYMDNKHKLYEILQQLKKKHELQEDIPLLAGLVSTSPIDMALHDGFGKANNMSVFKMYGKEYMEHDLSRYYGEEFKGKYIGNYLNKELPQELPVFHLVGGMDKLYKTDITDSDPKDGLPVALEEWIEQEKLFCFKVKLKGKAVADDLKRMLEVSNCIEKTLAKDKTKKDYFLSIDQNEMCESPDFNIELLTKLKQDMPTAYKAFLYIEQPTERNIMTSRHNMKILAALKPVLVDEGMLDIQTMKDALSLGWSGLALKVCKGFSSALLYVSYAKAKKIPYSVQDLTNPGLSLIASALFSGYINPIMGIEANGFQFIPKANKIEKKVFPKFFRRNGGVLALGEFVDLPGIGYSIEKMEEYNLILTD